MEQVEPTIIILCDDNLDLLTVVEEMMTSSMCSEQCGDLQVINISCVDDVLIEKLPHKEFNLARGKHTLLDWYAGIQKTCSQSAMEDGEDDDSTMARDMDVDMPEETTYKDPYDGESRQAYLQLSCHINWESCAMVCRKPVLPMKVTVLIDFRYLAQVRYCATLSSIIWEIQKTKMWETAVQHQLFFEK